MVTREELQEYWLGRLLPRAVKTASREVPPASATMHTQNWSQNQQAKNHQQPDHKLLSPGRSSVHHTPEELLFGPELESTSHWDPPFSYSQAALSLWVTGQGALENSEAGRMWSLLSRHQVFELDSWKVKRGPWACPVWLSWVRVDPCTKRSLVRFQVRVHAWVAGSVPQ